MAHRASAAATDMRVLLVLPAGREWMDFPAYQGSLATGALLDSQDLMAQMALLVHLVRTVNPDCLGTRAFLAELDYSEIMEWREVLAYLVHLEPKA